LLLILACTSVCEDLAGLERDDCLAQRIEAMSEPAEVRVEAEKIEDRIVLHAAVMTWVEAHRAADRQGLLELCGLLEHEHHTICKRRVEAAHLQ